MSREECGVGSPDEKGAVPIIIESSPSDPLMARVLEAAQKVIEDSGLALKLYIGSVEISEIPEDVLTQSACGYRLVCYGSDRFSDWYTDEQGHRWRRNFTRLKCRMLPRSSPPSEAKESEACH